MVDLLVLLAAGGAALAAFGWLMAAGLRNGDRPSDARVTAALGNAAQPDEPRPVVVATVRNPSGTPVLAGLSVRRARLPGWLAGGLDVTVPRRTARGRFRPGGYPTIGIVPALGTARFTVPVPASARRYLLTAVVGQAGGRLRVYRLRVAGAPVPPRARLAPVRTNPWRSGDYSDGNAMDFE